MRRPAVARSTFGPVGATAPDATPRANAEAWSLMLYTSGTTARPKACRAVTAPSAPPRSRMWRRICIARGERTLGVMPLYHTMGVRSLLAMSLIGGAFVCLPRFDAGARAATDRRANRSPTSIWCRRSTTTSCIIRDFAATDVALGAQARLCRRPDDRRAAEEAASSVPARAVRQPLRLARRSIPSPSIRTRRRSPARPARAGINQLIRVVKLGAAIARRHRAAPVRKARSSRDLRERRGLRGLLAPARRGRQGAARRLVLHRRHRLLSTPTATFSSPAGSTT